MIDYRSVGRKVSIVKSRRSREQLPGWAHRCSSILIHFDNWRRFCPYRQTVITTRRTNVRVTASAVHANFWGGVEIEEINQVEDLN